jgi:protein TonB
MGYQALLFCPDEKVARVAGQVFSELDFTVEPVSEPFVAVKKLMAQRYDAIVVDCENEQNATLLFKSAKNSSFNRSSLAIALVEGQAGVAKAYRIGANLLLTKPINVEQAKGTLRVARGLLRKNSDAAAATTASAAIPTAPAKPAPVPAASSFSPASGRAAAPSRPEFTEIKVPPAAIPAATPAAAPAMTASAKVEETPAIEIMPVSQTQIPLASRPAMKPRPPAYQRAIETEAAPHEEVKTSAAPVPSKSASPTFMSSMGSGAAPAPAKDLAAPSAKELREIEAALAHPSSATTSYDAAPVPTSSTASAGHAPTFAALNKDDAGGSGSKKILIAAVVVLVLGAAGYLGYTKLFNNRTASSPRVVSAPQDSGQPASALTPGANPAASTSTGAPGSANQTSASKPAAGVSPDKPSVAGTSPATRIAAVTDQGAKKPTPAPMVVRSGGSGARNQSQGQGDESAPSLAVGSANDRNLNGLMAGAGTVAKPSLSTMKISQGVSQGLVIKRVPPRYPSAALAFHAQGTVEIEVTINKEGNVTNPKVLSGSKIFVQSALDAVRQWRYKPYYLNGEPVEIQTQITIQFKPN